MFTEWSVVCRFRSDASGTPGMVLESKPMQFITRAKAIAVIESARRDPRFESATIREIKTEEVR